MDKMTEKHKAELLKNFLKIAVAVSKTPNTIDTIMELLLERGKDGVAYELEASFQKVIEGLKPAEQLLESLNNALPHLGPKVLKRGKKRGRIIHELKIQRPMINPKKIILGVHGERNGEVLC